MTKDQSILVKNIYYMLSYAFTALNQGEYENVATEEFDNLHNLFAAILAKGIGRQVKQGLHREYLIRKEDVAGVRGKIDMPGTIQNRLAKKRVLTCEYDELSENNLLNQILKTTVMILLRHAKVDAEYKTSLKKQMMFAMKRWLIPSARLHETPRLTFSCTKCNAACQTAQTQRDTPQCTITSTMPRASPLYIVCAGGSLFSFRPSHNGHTKLPAAVNRRSQFRSPSFSATRRYAGTAICGLSTDGVRSAHTALFVDSVLEVLVGDNVQS